MLIKSKFKDYYDYALSGFSMPDKNLIYNRQPIIKKQTRENNVKIPDLDNSNIYWLKDETGKLTSLFYVYFCGNLYKGIQEIDYEKGQYTSLKIFNDRYSYVDFEKGEESKIMELFKPIIEGHPIVTLKAFTNVKETCPNRTTGWTKKELKKDSKFKDEQSKVVLSDSLEYSKQFVINDCLKNVSFNKIKPAEIVYQELELFLGLQQSNEVDVSFNDKIKISQHGFNKESFRRRK